MVSSQYNLLRNLTGAVDELQTTRRGIFGSNGGYARTYALSNLSFSLGHLLGPLVSGGLADLVGYYWMNAVLGKSLALLRVRCLS